MKHIDIRMFGEFSLQADDVRITDSNKRSKKMWSLLAFLICNRENSVSQKKLIDLFYGEESDSANPENALRITLHRLRAELDQLWPGAGKELICYKGGNYCWNPEADFTLDCEQFDDMAISRPEDEDVRLEQYMTALALYQGEFLPKHSSENWVIPISVHFHNRFVDLTMITAQMLTKRERYSDATALCYRAVEAEPYHEALHQQLIKALGMMGDSKGASNAYEAISKRLFDDFGIRPSEETKEIYRAAAHSLEDRTVPMDEILDQVQDSNTARGALVCDYDYFKILCHIESRTMERSGHVTHIALFSLSNPNPTESAKKNPNKLTEQFGEHVRLNLRRGDTISRCSVSQYIIMLPKSNYENSCMVCRRVIASYQAAHPRSTLKINYMVQPLHPSMNVP